MTSKDTIKSFILNNYLFTDDMTQLKDDQSFLETGIIDSIGVMEIVLFLEEEFGIKIEDQEIAPENLDSIQGIMTFLNNKSVPLNV